MCAKNEYIMVSLAALLTALILILLIVMYSDTAYVIYSMDEFGYWSTAAWLNGADWTELAKVTPYYSYGSSLILALCYAATSSSAEMLHMSMVVNAFFVAAIVPLAYMVCRYLDERERPLLWLAVALLSALYASNIFYVQGGTECQLALLVWVLIYLSVRLISSPDNHAWSAVPFILCALALYITHQRCLGILLAGVIFLIVLWRKKILCSRQIAAAALMLALGLALHIFFKHQVQELVFLVSQRSGDIGNDYGRKLNNLMLAFTKQGFLDTIKVIAGQLFYFGAATFLVGYFGVFRVVRSVFSPDKTVNSGEKRYFYLFVLLAGVFTILIGSLTFNDFHESNRLDHIIYGRYNEILFGIFCLCGYLELSREQLIVRKVFLALLMYSCVAAVAYHMLKIRMTHSISYVNISAWAMIWDAHIPLAGKMLLGALGLAVILLIRRLYFRQGRRRGLLVLLVLALLSYNISSTVYINLQMAQPAKLGIQRFLRDVGYLYDDTDSIKVATIQTGKLSPFPNKDILRKLQFSHRNKKMSFVSFKDVSVPEQGLLSECLAPELLSGNKIRRVTKAINCNLVIIEPVGEKDDWSYIDIDSFVVAEAKQTAKTLFDMHMPFAAGEYELRFEMQSQEGIKQAVVVEVLGKNEKEVFARRMVEPYELTDESLTLYVPFMLVADIQDLKIRVVSDDSGVNVKQAWLKGSNGRRS